MVLLPVTFLSIVFNLKCRSSPSWGTCTLSSKPAAHTIMNVHVARSGHLDADRGLNTLTTTSTVVQRRTYQWLRLHHVYTSPTWVTMTASAQQSADVCPHGDTSSMGTLVQSLNCKCSTGAPIKKVYHDRQRQLRSIRNPIRRLELQVLNGRTDKEGGP